MSEDTKHNMKGKSISELEELFAGLGEPRFRAKQAFRRINLHLANDLDEFTEFPKALREKLRELDALPQMPMDSVSESTDGTIKSLFNTGRDKADNAAKNVEAVWIVSPKRKTLCISSQVGCTLNCVFCATGTLKFRGNLSTWQILEQVYEFMRRQGERPTNVVFMGMGEPLHNYENVIRAARILNHPEGLNIGARHITISTAGVVNSIERFIQSKEPFNLAISLNHPDPDFRSEVMDVDKKFPLEKLLNVARTYTKTLGRKITFEYVMMPDINMSPKHLKQLIKIARSVHCKVNLIPLNTTLRGFRRPSNEEISTFQDGLFEAGVAVFNRGSPGRDIDAACGMLALKKTKAPK